MFDTNIILFYTLKILYPAFYSAIILFIITDIRNKISNIAIAVTLYSIKIYQITKLLLSVKQIFVIFNFNFLLRKKFFADLKILLQFFKQVCILLTGIVLLSTTTGMGIGERPQIEYSVSSSL